MSFIKITEKEIIKSQQRVYRRIKLIAMFTNSIEKITSNKEKWYGDAKVFWDTVDPSVEGMLQGYGKISDTDCLGSQKYLDQLKKNGLLTTKCYRALDCGAGIGRVSKHFLLKEFDVVDIVEQCTEFTENIHKYMGDEKLSSRIEKIYNEGLQDFYPCPGHYDVIWIQWVVGHLTNDDFITFLLRCKQGLTQGGCIVVKDNVASGSTDVVDTSDSSFTRSLESFKSVFDKTGLSVEVSQVQDGFPTNLFPVRMFMLR